MLTPTHKTTISATYRVLAQRLSLRDRPTQRRMVAAVATALASGCPSDDDAEPTPPAPCLIEAPTGTGKSLGYLAAGIPLATELGRKLVVSTGTVALQQQLMEQDLPRFLSATASQVAVAVAKGRGRYLCPKALDDAVGIAAQSILDLPTSQLDAAANGPAGDRWHRPPTRDDRASVAAMQRAFDARTWDGDLDHWTAPITSNVRAAVTATAATCLGQRCPRAGDCPLMAARAACRSADVIVCNHALLLAEAAQRMDGCPTSSLTDLGDVLLVVDEAHQLATFARAQAARRLDLTSLGGLVTRLQRWGSAVIQQRLTADGPVEQARWAAAFEGLAQSLEDYSGEIHLLGQSQLDQEPAGLRRYPYGAVPDDVRIPFRHLHDETVRALRAVRGVLRRLSRSTQPGGDGLRLTTARLAEQLDEVRSLAEAFGDSPPMAIAQQDPQTWARWMVREERRVIAHASPASARDLLHQLLWSRSIPTVLTSATLSEGGNFRPILTELGLCGRPHTALALPSPFNLPEQAELRVPNIQASPTDVDAHTREVTGWLLSNLDWTSTAALVLFASRRQMEAVRDALPDPERAQVLCQTDATVAEVLRRHADRVNGGQASILFGLASFAEGVDLPGKLCTEVIVAKLSFAVPDDPVEATLTEVLEREGRSAFAERAVPEALRRLVQACGRLIRTESDRGRIVILDNRIVTKSYGRRMLSALPPYRLNVEPAGTIRGW